MQLFRIELFDRIEMNHLTLSMYTCIRPPRAVDANGDTVES